MERTTSDGLLDSILTRLEGVKRHGSYHTAKCPAHDDVQASLSIGSGGGGRVLLHCHALCDSQDVLGALGLTFADLFPDSGAKAQGGILPVTCEYEYRDENGHLLYVVERRMPKKFIQRRPDGNDGWLYNMEGIRRVPYRLPDVLRAVAEKRWVLIFEGEKDCDLARRDGFPTATTNPMGAGKWRDEFAPFFDGAYVAVVRDNDDVGREHGEQVAESLKPWAASVKIIDLPGTPEHGDFWDWRTAGGTRDDLAALVRSAPSRVEARTTASVGGASLRRASEYQQRPVDWLCFPRIPRGKLTMLMGDPSAGKSTISLDVAASVTNCHPIMEIGRPLGQPEDVILIQYEDDPEDTTIPRLARMGADLDRVHFLRWALPDGSDREFLAGDLRALDRLLDSLDTVGMIVVDPVTSLTSRVNGNGDGDVRQALQPLVQIASHHRAAVLGLIHMNKGNDGGNVLYRMMGSVAYMALARSVLFAGMESESGRRAVAHVKCNLAPLGVPLEYRLGGEKGFFWLGDAPDLDEKALLRKPKPERRSQSGEW